MSTPDAGPGRAHPLLVCLVALVAVAATGPIEPVIVATAEQISFPFTIEALGTIRANEAVEIRAQITERVTEIRFAEGEHVDAGAVLVELDATRARADVAAAKAELVESETQLRRAAQLRDARSLSQAEYDSRLAERDARRAALAVAEASLGDTKVRAPFEGRVGLRRVSTGSLVGPDTVITTLDDTDPVKLDFDVPETLISHVEQGARISARSAAFGNERFAGHVASVDTRVDPISRSLTVRAVLPNPDGRLRPGMFVTVTLAREDVEALVVPEQAIVPDQSRQFVLVIDAERRVERRDVRTGRRRPGLVEVVSGLVAGERIVVEGTQRARPGAVVEIVGERSVRDLAGATSGDAPTPTIDEEGEERAP